MSQLTSACGQTREVRAAFIDGDFPEVCVGFSSAPCGEALQSHPQTDLQRDLARRSFYASESHESSCRNPSHVGASSMWDFITSILVWSIWSSTSATFDGNARQRLCNTLILWSRVLEAYRKYTTWGMPYDVIYNCQNWHLHRIPMEVIEEEDD
ncbi:uncharacterized protein LY79DRAFT_160284 [Colletotrichum navitas]|uniref:Uncharacterized protein n=1 Tax=Colletotrichum navitas TaxID=681940 RepID=A0AAD8Q3I2_9PEZI|nr:uncharacterized protein LY79DRAFT_160284 [Colletotrichum navitas]KAK1594134.1 hypothetical protein LY79DRAFT_160284 [Colletotrichum navitas]